MSRYPPHPVGTLKFVTVVPFRAGRRCCRLPERTARPPPSDKRYPADSKQLTITLVNNYQRTRATVKVHWSLLFSEVPRCRRRLRDALLNPKTDLIPNEKQTCFIADEKSHASARYTTIKVRAQLFCSSEVSQFGNLRKPLGKTDFEKKKKLLSYIYYTYRMKNPMGLDIQRESCKNEMVYYSFFFRRVWVKEPRRSEKHFIFTRKSICLYRSTRRGLGTKRKFCLKKNVAFSRRLWVDPFRTLSSLPTLILSNFVPQNGFPAVKA